MKVIGKVDNRTAIAEVTAAELSLALGAYGTDVQVGMELDFGELAKCTKNVKALGKDTLVHAKNYLERALKEVDNAIEIIDKLSLLDRLRED